MKSALKLVLFPLFAIGVFGADEVKSVSVTEGESVTLNSNVTEIQRNDELLWRLNKNLIFRISSDSNNKITVIDKTDGVYGDRLKPDEKTGDLKITNIKTTDSGEYKLKIRYNIGSSEKIFNVSVAPRSGTSSDSGPSPDSGLSSGVIAGIAVGVFAVLAAAVGGVYYGSRARRQTSDSPFDEEVQHLIK